MEDQSTMPTKKNAKEYKQIEKLFVELNAKKIQPMSAESEELKNVIRRCVEVSRWVKSYRAVCLMTEKNSTEYTTKWWVDFASPNRLRAKQHYRPENFWDVWVTVGQRHYPAVWAPIEQHPIKLDAKAAGLNRMLRLDRYLGIIQRRVPARCGMFRNKSSQYWVVEYSGKSGDDSSDALFMAGFDKVHWETTIWIDIGRNVITKAVTKVSENGESRGNQTARIEHVFGDYNSEISIPETNHHFDQFITYFYQRRDLSQVPEALEYAAESLVLSPENGPNLGLYFFVRLAQLEPSVIPHYKAMLETISEEGRPFISSALRLATGDTSFELDVPLDPRFPTEFDVLQRPVTCPADLDYLWGEFLVTGNKKAVIRIIEVLSWPDRLREKIEKWLQEPTKNLLSWWIKKRRLRLLRRVTGVTCDVGTNSVKTLADVDCTLSYGFQLDSCNKEHIEKVAAALPFDLNEFDRVYMGTKGSAIWSVDSNAIQHHRVFAVCAEMASTQTGSLGAVLQEILVKGYHSRGDPRRASRAVADYLRHKPTLKEATAKLLFSKQETQKLMELARDTSSNECFRHSLYLLRNQTTEER